MMGRGVPVCGSFSNAVTRYCRTLIDTNAKFHCGLGRWTGIPARLEGLGVSRFKEHLQKSRKALMYVVERIRSSPDAKAATTGGSGRVTV